MTDHSAGMALVGAEEERRLIERLLLRLGASEREAALQADSYVEADLRGFHSHGVQRVPVLVKRIQQGLIRLGEKPELKWLSPCCLQVEGRSGLGPFVAMEALEAASERSRESGAALVSIRDSSHSVMVGYYCEHWARRGRILIGMTTSEALVHPQGGAEALLGTNPIAMGIPMEDGPFVFDMATSASAYGKIQDLRNRGQAIPEGWAVDRDGHPTTDAEAALQGSLNPAGGAKGYALGLGIELLVGMLAGTPFGQDVLGTLDTEHACTKGDLFIMIDPSSFPHFPERGAAAAAYLGAIRESKPQPGGPGVRLPGDRSRELRAARLRDGIPLPQSVWEAVKRLADEVARPGEEKT